MISADKQLLLSGFLGQLPEPIAARLAKAVEVDRLIGGTGLPHEEILRALRPQLRQTVPSQRTPTPQRFFCQPFEDLLVGSGRTTKQKGRITRTSIEPIWNWLAVELMPTRLQAISAAIRDAVLRGRDGDVEEKCAELWSEAAAALKPALEDEKKKVIAAKKLGGIGIAEDAAEIALLMGGAKEIEALQKRLPKPIAALTEEDILFLRDTFDRLTVSQPDLAPYVPLVIMGRLERPWEALRLAGALSRKLTDTVISNTDLGLAGEILFSDLDEYIKNIQNVRPPDFDAEKLLANLAGFTELSSGMVKEIGIRRDGKWGQRLTKDRGAVAQVVEGLLAKAPKEILAALPAAKAGFGKGHKPLDVSRGLDPDRAAKAMRYAQLMVHSRPFAVAGAFNAKVNEAIAETAGALRMLSEDLLREVRAASEATRPHLETQFALMLDLCALVLGEEEADLLRRRGRVPATA